MTTISRDFAADCDGLSPHSTSRLPAFILVAVQRIWRKNRQSVPDARVAAACTSSSDPIPPLLQV
jgi:hypothetical protein